MHACTSTASWPHHHQHGAAVESQLSAGNCRMTRMLSCPSLEPSSSCLTTKLPFCPDKPTQAPQGTLGRLRQQLAASLWGPSDPSQQQQQHPSLTASALTSLKATAARWLAKKAEDPESREALLAFGSSSLLDFLVGTATEEDSSPEQQHAEQAVVSGCAGRWY